MPTDLEKWKKLLDETGIKYEEDKTITEINLIIDDSCFDSYVYAPSLSIEFNKDGSFKCFYPTGE